MMQIRSVPGQGSTSLFEMVYYKYKSLEDFKLEGKLEDHDNEWIWNSFEHIEAEKDDIKPKLFADYDSIFNYLNPPEKIIPYMKEKASKK